MSSGNPETDPPHNCRTVPMHDTRQGCKGWNVIYKGRNHKRPPDFARFRQLATFCKAQLSAVCFRHSAELRIQPETSLRQLWVISPYYDTLSAQCRSLVAQPGVEPKLLGYEPGVLPLDHRAILPGICRAGF